METQRAIHQAGCVTNARNKSGKLSEFWVGVRFRDINDSAPREVPRNILDRSDTLQFIIHSENPLVLSKDLHTELSNKLECALTIKYLLCVPH